MEDFYTGQFGDSLVTRTGLEGYLDLRSIARLGFDRLPSFIISQDDPEG